MEKLFVSFSCAMAIKRHFGKWVIPIKFTLWGFERELPSVFESKTPFPASNSLFPSFFSYCHPSLSLSKSQFLCDLTRILKTVWVWEKWDFLGENLRWAERKIYLKRASKRWLWCFSDGEQLRKEPIKNGQVTMMRASHFDFGEDCKIQSLSWKMRMASMAAHASR